MTRSSCQLLHLVSYFHDATVRNHGETPSTSTFSVTRSLEHREKGREKRREKEEEKKDQAKKTKSCHCVLRTFVRFANLTSRWTLISHLQENRARRVMKRVDILHHHGTLNITPVYRSYLHERAREDIITHSSLSTITAAGRCSYLVEIST